METRCELPNQAGAERGQIENPDDKREQAGEVEEDDAPRQAGKAQADEKVPGATGKSAAALGSGQGIVEPLGLDGRCQAIGSLFEHVVRRVARPLNSAAS